MIKLKTKTKEITTWALALFIILNAFKYTWFSLWLVNGKADLYVAKFIIELGTMGIIYLFIFKWRVRFIFILFYLTQAFFIYAHVSYFSFFKEILNAITQFSNFKEGVELVKGWAIPFYSFNFVILLDAPIFLFLYLSFKKVELRPLLFRWGVIVCSLFIIVQQIIFYLDEPISIKKGAMEIRIDNMELVICYGLAFQNIFNYWQFEQEKKIFKNINYGPAIKINSKKSYNFILIQVESLQSGFLETRYKGKAIMPNLVKYTEEYLYFPYTFSYHLGGHSADADVSVINNIQPFRNQSLIYSKSYQYPNSFLKILNDLGYSTKGFHNNHGWFFNRNDAYKQMDFDQFFDHEKMGYKSYFWGLPEKKMFDFMLKHLKKEESPFCYYSVTMSTHSPFQSHKNFYTNRDYDDIKIRDTKDIFIGFTYLDEVLGEFIEKVKYLDQNTIIFIFGDHAVYESKYVKTARYKEKDRLFEYVPLVIIAPLEITENLNLSKPKSVISFHDLAPTLLWKSGYQGNYLSFGGNILSDKKITNSIPFLQGQFNRKDLFKKIHNFQTNQP